MSAFSNSTEYEIWAANWCHRCMKDDLGGAPDGVWCPILSNVVCLNEVPPEWTEGDGPGTYSCAEFVEVPA